MPLDYPHPTELEQRVGLHYKPFRLFRLTPSLAIQPLVRAIFFYLASNPRSRASAISLINADQGTSIAVNLIQTVIWKFLNCNGNITETAV